MYIRVLYIGKYPPLVGEIIVDRILGEKYVKGKRKRWQMFMKNKKRERKKGERKRGWEVKG
jgi:hypothetical protein